MPDRRTVLVAGIFSLLLAGCTSTTETNVAAAHTEQVTVHVEGMTKVQGIT